MPRSQFEINWGVLYPSLSDTSLCDKPEANLFCLSSSATIKHHNLFLFFKTQFRACPHVGTKFLGRKFFLLHSAIPIGILYPSVLETLVSEFEKNSHRTSVELLYSREDNAIPAESDTNSDINNSHCGIYLFET